MNTQPRPIQVPIELAGLWIAWSHDHRAIVASGRTYEEARDAAERADEPNAYLTKAPKASTRLIGGHA